MKKEEKQSYKLLSPHEQAKLLTSGKVEPQKTVFPGYPHYPASEDIYNRDKEVDLDPENLTEMKTPPTPSDTPNEKGFKDDMTGEDLDVPGSKADEATRNFGSEDEENNYYSLGGDDHNDLEEDVGY